MSYSKEYVRNNTIRQVDLLWADELKQQWKHFTRWGEIYDTITTRIPHNCSILDLGAGHEPIKKYKKHNSDYLSIDFCGKSMLNEDLNYQYLDLWKYRSGGKPLPEGAIKKPWAVGLCVELLEYLIDPGAFLEHYKQYAFRWIITARVSRPDHIYLGPHPLRHRWRSHQEFVAFLKNHFSMVGAQPIQTNLKTCAGKMKPFVMAVCEV